MSLLLAALTSLSLGGVDPTQGFPDFPGARPVQIGGELVVSSEFYRLAYFTTAQPPQAVARFYGQAWSQQGLPVTIVGDFDAEGCVASFSTREGVQRIVVLRVHQKRTLVFLVTKNLWELSPRSVGNSLRAAPGELPLRAWVRGTHGPDGRADTELLPLGLAEARASVLREFERDGFVLESEREHRLRSPLRLELVHRKAAERVVTTLVSQAAGWTVRLSMSLPVREVTSAGEQEP